MALKKSPKILWAFLVKALKGMQAPKITSTDTKEIITPGENSTQQRRIPGLVMQTAYTTPDPHFVHKQIGIVMGILLSGFILLYGSYAALEGALENNQKNLITAADQQKRLKNALSYEAFYKEAESQKTPLYQQFQKTHLNSPVKITALEAHLRKWQKALKIPSIRFTLSDPITETKASSLVRVRITIDLVLKSEGSFFALIQKMQRDIPGMMIVRSFHLSKTPTPEPDTKKPTPDMEKPIAKKPIRKQNRLQGQLECDWLFIKAE